MAGEILSDNDLDLIFRNGRSYNGFDSRPVTRVQIEAMYDLLKAGPTSANTQPGRYVFCLSQESRDKLAACASEGNADKIRNAPAAVVVGMDMEFYEKMPEVFPHNPDAKNWFSGPAIETTAFRNSTLQGAYLMIAARALGLDVGPMSGFDHDQVDAAFFAGTPIKSNFISTIGYGDPASIFEKLPRLSFDDACKVL